MTQKTAADSHGPFFRDFLSRHTRRTKRKRDYSWSILSPIITDTSVKGRSLRLCCKGVVAKQRLAG